MAERENGGNRLNHSELPDRDRERILFALRQIARALDIHSRRLASEKEVTSVQLLAMKMLNREGVETATDVARVMRLSPSTVVGILDRLEEKDFIERTRDRRDRRIVRVTLTPRARELVRGTPHPVVEMLSAGDDGLSDSEVARVADALELLVRALSASEVDTRAPGPVNGT